MEAEDDFFPLQSNRRYRLKPREWLDSAWHGRVIRVLSLRHHRDIQSWPDKGRTGWFLDCAEGLIMLTDTQIERAGLPDISAAFEDLGGFDRARALAYRNKLHRAKLRAARAEDPELLALQREEDVLSYKNKASGRAEQARQKSAEKRWLAGHTGGRDRFGFFWPRFRKAFLRPTARIPAPLCAEPVEIRRQDPAKSPIPFPWPKIERLKAHCEITKQGRWTLRELVELSDDYMPSELEKNPDAAEASFHGLIFRKDKGLWKFAAVAEEICEFRIDRL